MGATILSAALGGAGCNGLLDAPLPAGVSTPGTLTGTQGAAAIRGGVVANFNTAFAGASVMSVVASTGLLVDEFSDASGFSGFTGIDNRTFGGESFGQTSGGPYRSLQSNRFAAARAINDLRAISGAVAHAWIGDVFARAAYDETLLAEAESSGVPLSELDASGHVAYGTPLTTALLLARATADFDSAIAYAGDSARFVTLAQIGKGRAMLDAGRFADAATAVVDVPADFLLTADYSSQLVSIYSSLFFPFVLTVSDREGTNGLPYVTGGDPRVPTVFLGTSPSNGVTPVFDLTTYESGTTPLPIASGVEARLIRAEAALPVHGGTGTAWLDTLNALRSSVPGLAPLTDPGTNDARIDVLFAERAYWLFGTGHRLGDLRRLVRQYQRGPETVFPTGMYAGGGSYGTTVSFIITTEEGNNPNFHGCLDRGA